VKRFSFKLEALLEARTREEDAVKLRLAEKNRQLQSLGADMEALHAKLSDMQLSQKKQRSTADNVNALRQSVAYRHRLKLEMLKKGREVDDLREETEYVRDELITASRRRRAVEMLKERRYRAWRHEIKIKEQVVVDDISQTAYARRRNRVGGGLA
jgi:flagellar FliJ protein